MTIRKTKVFKKLQRQGMFAYVWLRLIIRVLIRKLALSNSQHNREKK